MKLRCTKLATATALVLAFAASPALALVPGTSRGFENGGKFYRFDPVVAEYNQSGVPFRIVGRCASACTLFLSIKNVCVERTATFHFHAGSDGKGNISTYATRHMMDAYNPKLRHFVIQNGYMVDFTFHAISGADIIDKFGYAECPAHYRQQEAELRDTQRTGGEGSFIERPRSVQQQTAAPRGSEGNFRSN